MTVKITVITLTHRFNEMINVYRVNAAFPYPFLFLFLFVTVLESSTSTVFFVRNCS